MHDPLAAPRSVRSGRRQFLKVACAGGLTLGLGRLPGVQAADPVKRNGKVHLKLSLAAYSFRDFLQPPRGAAPTMTLDDFIRLCADYNLDGTEPTSYYFPKDFGDDYLIHLKALTFRLGLDISGTAIRNDFCQAAGPKRDDDLAHTRKWIDYSATMGAPVIRIFAGNVPRGEELDAVIRRCADGINESLDYAAKKGVILGLENHGGITDNPETMLKIIAAVKESPWFGVNFDGGNFHNADPYGDLAKIAPYAVNAQVKTDLTYAGKSEKADLERVVKILVDAGYRGYVVLEYEGKEDPKVAVPKHLDELKKIISKV